jgi:hypothetical protein
MLWPFLFRVGTTNAFCPREVRQGKQSPFQLKEKAMSKLFSFGFVAAVITFAAAQPANADYRYCGCYSWYYYPSAPVAAAPAAPVSSKPAPPAGQTAQSQNYTYRSFSAEPAPAATTTSPGSTVSGGTFYGGTYGDPGNLNASQNDPSGMDRTVLGGTPGNGSNYGTAGNPYGGSNMTIIGGGGGGSFYGGGTQGGTAGHPY